MSLPTGKEKRSQTLPRPLSQHHLSQSWRNELSSRRSTLLLQLKDALKMEKVPAAFWACLQVCDFEQLERLIAVAAISPHIGILDAAAPTYVSTLLYTNLKPEKHQCLGA